MMVIETINDWIGYVIVMTMFGLIYGFHIGKTHARLNIEKCFKQWHTEENKSGM